MEKRGGGGRCRGGGCCPRRWSPSFPGAPAGWEGAGWEHRGGRGRLGMRLRGLGGGGYGNPDAFFAAQPPEQGAAGPSSHPGSGFVPTASPCSRGPWVRSILGRSHHLPGHHPLSIPSPVAPYLLLAAGLPRWAPPARAASLPLARGPPPSRGVRGGGRSPHSRSAAQRRRLPSGSGLRRGAGMRGTGDAGTGMRGRRDAARGKHPAPCGQHLHARQAFV